MSVGFSNVLVEDVVVQFFGTVEQLQLKGHAFGEQDRCVDSLLSSSGSPEAGGLISFAELKRDTVRATYVQAVLRQDVSWFAGEV